MFVSRVSKSMPGLCGLRIRTTRAPFTCLFRLRPVEVFFGPEGKEERETVAPGQVHFFKSNTPHGFKNPGSTPVTFIEIFVKNTGRASNDPLQSLALALNALRNKQ